MGRFSTIHYLRWARSPARLSEAEIPLILSGMTAPDPEALGKLSTSELLAFSAADHPPLAATLAESWGLEERQVLLQPGSHWNLLILLAARLQSRPGPVVVESPTYEPLLRIPEALGAEILRLPRRREQDFALDLNRLHELSARRPSVLLLSHPHNPSGAVLSEIERDEIERFCAAGGCALLSDEVYLEFLEDWPRRSLLGCGPEAVVVRSFTKVFGLGALRCSAAAGDAEWIAQAARITDHGPVALPAPSQALAARAWAHRDVLWERARTAAATGRQHVEAFVRRVEDLLEVFVPTAGIICFPRLREASHLAALRAARADDVNGPFGDGLDGAGFEDGSHLWIEDLLRREGVRVTPGEFFGDSRAFRLGFGGDPQALTTGLERMERHLRRAMEEA